jgi:hypothetical protein
VVVGGGDIQFLVSVISSKIIYKKKKNAKKYKPRKIVHIDFYAVYACK